MTTDPNLRIKLGELQCENWNLKYRPGQAVIVTRDNGAEQNTKTTSEAYMLSGHTPVVQLDGISGCYHLSRVRPEVVQ